MILYSKKADGQEVPDNLFLKLVIRMLDNRHRSSDERIFKVLDMSENEIKMFHDGLLVALKMSDEYNMDVINIETNEVFETVSFNPYMDEHEQDRDNPLDNEEKEIIKSESFYESSKEATRAISRLVSSVMDVKVNVCHEKAEEYGYYPMTTRELIIKIPELYALNYEDEDVLLDVRKILNAELIDEKEDIIAITFETGLSVLFEGEGGELIEKINTAKAKVRERFSNISKYDFQHGLN